MKKFKNVNGNSFISASTSLLNNINYSNEQNIISSIDNESIWSCNSKKNLRGNLAMFMIEYQKLQKNVEYLTDASKKVKKYNDIAEEIERLKLVKKQLESLKYMDVEINGVFTREINYDIVQEINRVSIEISNKMSQLTSLFADIKSLISRIK